MALTTVWREFKTKCDKLILCYSQDSDLYVEKRIAECIHWAFDIKRLLVEDKSHLYEFGSSSSTSLNHTEVVGGNTHVTVMFSGMLDQSFLSTCELVLGDGRYQTCTICTLLPEQVHAYYRTGMETEGTVFKDIVAKLRVMLADQKATVDISVVPLYCVSPLSDLFVLPACSMLYPATDLDVPVIQAVLLSKGDRRILKSLRDVELGMLPHPARTSVKVMANTLAGILEQLHINEDIFVLGSYSHLVATELANCSTGIARKKSNTRASLVLVDRNLDLASCTDCTNSSLLDLVFRALPRLPGHHNDVAIPLYPRITDSLGWFPGCLAHPGDPEVMQLLDELAGMTVEQGLQCIRQHLLVRLQREKVTAPKLTGKSAHSDLTFLLESYKANSQLLKKNLGILQIACAVLEALDGGNIGSLETLSNLEEVIHFQPLGRGILAELEEIIQNELKPGRITLLEFMVLACHSFSMMGPSTTGLTNQIRDLKEKLVGALVTSELLKEETFSLTGARLGDEGLERLVCQLLDRLLSIKDSRQDLKHLRSVVAQDGESISPLVSQILRCVLGQQAGMDDMELVSVGLKDLLKTGLSYFISSNKVRPNNHRFLIIFVMGGITFREIYECRRILRASNSDVEVLFGSTSIPTPTLVVKRALFDDNLLLDLFSL